ncbi:hypothetical protein JNUCC0626_08940 [Lentzea sp. JNUCC 0626]|uniref:hypothetical protein n=1 Tax=Lentzea sp. JNUCC 0626 TaxID=3367513 RepID=UPI003748BB3C
MGMDLWGYPAAVPVVEAYARHVARLPETEGRRALRTYLADTLREKPLPGLDPSVLLA